MANMKTAMKREKHQMAGKLAVARANIGRLFRSQAGLFMLLDIEVLQREDNNPTRFQYTIYNLDYGTIDTWIYYGLYTNLPSSAWVTPPRESPVE